MKIHITSDEVNVLVHRYLLENGFSHTAFSFSNEATMSKNPFWVTHSEKLPPNALVSFLQKAMMYIYVEYHTDDDTGEEIRCNEPFSIFRRHDCWFPYERDTELEEDAVLSSSKLTDMAVPANRGDTQRNGNSLNRDGDTETTNFPSGKRAAVRAQKMEKIKKRSRQSSERLEDDESNNDMEDTVNDQVSVESEYPGNKGGDEAEGVSHGDSSYQLAGNELLSNGGSYHKEHLTFPRELGEEAANDVCIDSSHGGKAQKEKLQNYAILVDHNESSDSGALSEWSPSDPFLLVTNFALDSPHLYRVPSKCEGVMWVTPIKDLQGPALDSHQINPGSVSCWKHDGSLVVTGYESGHVCIWTNEGILIATLQVSSLSVICVAFSSYGTHLAAAAADGLVCIWKVDDLEAPAVRIVTYKHIGSVIEIDWKNDYVLSSGSVDKSVVIYDISLDKQITLHQDSEIAGLRWNQDGMFLAIVDASAVVKIWRDGQTTDEPMIELIGHHDTVIKAEWLNNPDASSKHSVLVTVSMDSNLIVWDVETASIVKIISYHQPPASLRASPNGTHLAVCTYDYGLRIYKMPEMEPFKTYFDNSVIPHVSWNCNDESIVYNVFNTRKTVAINVYT